MKKVLKNTIEYTVIFLLVVLLLLSFLVVTAKIPKNKIQENIKKSTKDIHTEFEIDEVIKRRDYTFRHVYADVMVLNIIYCTDSNNPLTSVLESKYYIENESEVRKISYDLEKLVDSEVEGNMQYLRYWHGYTGIVRILLLFFDLGQIYILNGIMLSILTISLIIILIRKKAFAVIFAFIIGMIMIAANVVPSCLEYTWQFYVMLISSILAVIWKDDNKKLNKLFFITGIVSCFLDFLSTEIITIGVPIIITLTLKVKEKQIVNFKEGCIFVIKSCLLWGISYAMMWIAKWILASIVLQINAFDYVIEEAKYRINGELFYGKMKNFQWKAIKRNLFTLYPLNIQKTVKKLIGIPIGMIIFELIFIRKKELKKLWLSLLLILVSLMPYIRYCVLANHSYTHYFFTFRSQIITVMGIVLAMIYSIDFVWWKDRIKNKNRRM